MAGESILIVDDNLRYLTLVRTLLQAEGYGVRTAVDAEEALEVLKAFHPCLILMDIQLPGMDGLELTRMLKANTDTREMTVVAFSGSAIPKTDALDAGCEGYIAKPIDTRILIRLVAEYLQRVQQKNAP
jgi:CheY-like chemotaxis protein